MNYKVFIPAAGTGSRLAEVCRHLNKSLVSVGHKPAICHIIEKFPPEIAFVIALGYRGDLVREFVQLAYPQRQFVFVEVSPYKGADSGLGHTVLSCSEHLQCPFIFCSCDTIVDEPIPAPTGNWMGCSEVANPSGYRSVGVSGGVVTAIHEKSAIGDGLKAYIGLAGVKDFEIFWGAMKDGPRSTVLDQGESYGLRSLLAQKTHALKFRWHDTGSLESLANAREAFLPKDAPNILPKTDEDIWFVDGSVIKFSADKRFIADRVRRSRLLKGYCPEIISSGVHMYKYARAGGEVLSRVVTLPVFGELLKHAQTFWAPQKLAQEDAQRFKSVCMDFYRAKTFQRVAQFHETFGRADRALKINGVPVPTTAELLDRIDWEWLSCGIPGTFHGDFHFENILYSSDKKTFTFLDWRQNFGGLMETGDIYYDLAKLNHGLVVCHDLIARNLFEVVETESEVRFELLRKQLLVDCERHFEVFLRASGYDVAKVKMLTALIYLNIAALHHYPYSLLLYYLGKSILNEECSRLSPAPNTGDGMVAGTPMPTLL